MKRLTYLLVSGLLMIGLVIGACGCGSSGDDSESAASLSDAASTEAEANTTSLDHFMGGWATSWRNRACALSSSLTITTAHSQRIELRRNSGLRPSDSRRSFAILFARLAGDRDSSCGCTLARSRQPLPHRPATQKEKTIPIDKKMLFI